MPSTFIKIQNCKEIMRLKCNPCLQSPGILCTQTQKNDMATIAARPRTNLLIVANLFTPIPIAFIIAERGVKRKKLKPLFLFYFFFVIAVSTSLPIYYTQNPCTEFYWELC